jgi:DNA-binding MarR family transcriptional regulator
MMQTDIAEADASSESQSLDPGLLNDFVGPKVRILWNILSSRMAEALEPFGLRTGAFSALALIAANPGCSQNQLAQGLGMDKSAVVAIVDDLENKGLASRIRQPLDRRRHALKLTAKGKTLMQRMFTPAQYAGRPIRDKLSARELTQLMALLDRACDALIEAELVAKATPNAGKRRR